MRRASRIDANQPEIVDALRKAGASVRPTHMVGAGFPDLVVGYGKQTFLVEVKDGSKARSRQRLTEDQIDFFDEWRGHAVVINSVDAALAWLAEVKAG